MAMTNQSKTAVAMLLAVVLAVLLAVDQGYIPAIHTGPPAGVRTVVILHETANRPPELWALLHDIRTSDKLKEHNILILDDDGEGESFDLMRAELDGTSPGIIVGVPDPDNPLRFKPVASGPLPTTLDKVLDFIQENGG